jgi:membrane protease YdiL (CAAX protease family)
MRSYLRIHSPWSQLAVLILSLAGAFVVTLLISSVVLISKGIAVTDLKNINYDDAKIISVLKLVQGISTITIFLLPAIAFAFFTFRFRQFYFLGFRKHEKVSFYLLAVVIIFCSFPFVGWLGELNSHIHLAKWMVDSEKEAGKQMEAFLKVNSSSDIIINILLVALLPAICEEVFFRGCLQRILIYAFKSPWTGIIITAALFSAFHMQFEGFLPRMFLGILLGALFWYSNSLWPNIVAHFFNNAIQVIAVLYYPKMINENPSIPIYAALISGIIVFGLLFFLRRQSTVSYAKIYETEKANNYDEFPE